MSNNAEAGVEFHLGGFQHQLNRAKLSRRRALTATCIFLAGCAFVLLLSDLSDLQAGTLSPLRWGTLIGLAGFCFAMIAWTVPYIVSRRDGATLLRVTETGFTLRYPDGRGQSVRWSDPKATFQLYDWAISSASLRATFTTPFTIVIDRVQSALSSEAFDAIQTAARRHGLSEAVATGSPWVYSSGVRPSIITFKSGTRANV